MILQCHNGLEFFLLHLFIYTQISPLNFVFFTFSNLIIVCDLFTVKPRIDRTHLKQTVVKAGRNVKFDINIEGEPAPEVKWILLDKEVVQS